MEMVIATLLLVSAAAVSADQHAKGEAHEHGNMEKSTGYMHGVWSLGETKNCDIGPAWVFLADGYYAEVTLPDKGPSATGLWRDEGNAIAYTHSHMPFPDMMKANEMKRLTIDARTPDKLVTKNYKGVPRIFHRCPTDALKAPAGQGAH